MSDDSKRIRMPRGAKYVLSIEMGGVGTSSSESFYLSRTPDQRGWRLWSRYFCDELNRSVTGIFEECPRKGVPAEMAAERLMIEYWKWYQREWDLEYPPRISGLGILTDEQIERIREAVWSK